jgi:hypothetical protein
LTPRIKAFVEAGSITLAGEMACGKSFCSWMPKYHGRKPNGQPH